MRISPVLLALVLSLHAASVPDSRKLDQGRALFRSNCAFCHGLDGRGGRGPDLTGRLVHGDTLPAIKNVIRRGIPGTNMPAFGFDEEESGAIAMYVRNLSHGSAKPEVATGDPRHGAEVYNANGCAGCHRIGDTGSVFGPDLSRAGAARSLAYLRESIVNPSADVPEEWEGVSVTDRDGHRVAGVRVNEDTFTVQLRDQSQKFRMFDKSDLREVDHMKRSLMPAYKLGAKDLNDLIAYLATLRGSVEGDRVIRARGVK